MPKVSAASHNRIVSLLLLLSPLSAKKEKEGRKKTVKLLARAKIEVFATLCYNRSISLPKPDAAKPPERMTPAFGCRRYRLEFGAKE
jgi:hypothetical protein